MVAVEKIDQQSAIEIRSGEMDEILGRKPVRLIRYGISVIFVVILILLTGSYFFKYPDIITAPVTICTENLPINLPARVNGKISGLNVHDRQQVSEGEVLAILENPANYSDVALLKAKLDSVQYCFKSDRYRTYGTIDSIRFDEALILGQMQTDYISFIKALSDLNLFIETDFQHKKIASLKVQKSKYLSLRRKSQIQCNLSQEQFELAQLQFSRDSGLMSNSAISKVEFEKSRRELLQNKSSLENAKSSIDNSDLSVAQMDQQIIELEQQYEEQYKQLYAVLSSSYNSLLNQIKTWEQSYLVVSPIKGQVSFTKFWSVNQDVVTGDVVFTIVPDKPERIIGKIELPISGSGKVRTGQKVNIKLENYPYMEYGVLSGSVQGISLVPINKTYYAEVALANGLTTNYGKDLPFSNQLQGSAEIITDDLRLIERFLAPLKSVWKNRTGN